MKTWCFGQFFILVGFLKTTQTLEQFGGYLSARLEKKEKVLHFVVLRHKILTVLNQFKKKYLRSSMNLSPTYFLASLGLCVILFLRWIGSDKKSVGNMDQHESIMIFDVTAFVFSVSFVVIQTHLEQDEIVNTRLRPGTFDKHLHLAHLRLA